MALTDLERKRCERDIAKFMERRRPPPHIRPKLDLGYKIEGQSVEIFEIRPDWQNQRRQCSLPWPSQRSFALRIVGRFTGCAAT